MPFTEVLLLATNAENLEVSWPQGLFLKVEPRKREIENEC